ncbi:MAG: serine/threonine protein kinase [Planctomycetaceae bacterium]|nr:serine/threonine protein kinase [Planctomycetaceae bacterium]
MKAIVSYRSILMTAVVAAIFSTIVCALLLVDAAYRLSKVPTESPDFVKDRLDFVDQPNNDELRKRIRQRDLELRQEYFREQRFTETGSYLLLGGVALTLIMGKWALTIRRKLPAPKPKESGPDSDERLSHTGLWAVSVLILALFGTTWAMKASSPSALPATLEELAALRERAEENNGEVEAAEDKGAAPEPAIPELPTPEEVRQSWPSFRGPDGSGISMFANVPRSWDAASGEGIAWKTPVPLSGFNSPIVWKDRVFLSGATEDQRAVYCFDAATGQILWQKDVAGNALSGSDPPRVSQDTGYAAPTMVTDGRFVYAMFATGDLTAFDFAGNEMWSQSLGVPKNTYGHASSLATVQGSVIVQFDQGNGKDDLSRLLAIDGVTGETVWEVKRAMPSSWSSPIVVQHDGQVQLITCGDPWVIANSPVDGKEIWRVSCFERAEVGPSPVYVDGTVFAANDMAALSAIRADGSGDVTDTHTLWSSDFNMPDTCSPLVTDEFVLLMSFGLLTCYDKKEGGDPLWEEDLEADFISSPGLVGNQVYLFGKEGNVLIVEPTRDECKRIAEADLGEECVTSPAFQDGRIYIRGMEHLICIGTAAESFNRALTGIVSTEK